MYLRTLEIYVLKYAKLILQNFFQLQDLKKTKVKLDLLTGIDMLLMVENEIGGGICHTVH